MSSATLIRIPLNGAYPQREITRESWLDARGRSLKGRVRRALARGDARCRKVAAAVARFGPASAALGDAELKARAVEIGTLLHQRGLEDELVFECFALVRELSGRVLSKRHFDVQVYAAWVLLHGNVAEMNTGEGKTLTATLAVATAALAGIPTHVVTVNDYLVERDARELAPLYQALGLSVGTILEDMTPNERRAAYACDITYCTNKELVFDFLKDRITLARDSGGARLQLERVYGAQNRSDRLLMRGLHYAIVDEADSALIDEARVPVIISRSVEDSEQNTFYEQAMALARDLVRDVDYLVDERERRVQLTDAGRQRIEAFAGDKRGIWNMSHWREAGMLQALSALALYLRDQHYLVVDDAIHIIDEFTGRTMPDRSWEMGLHQLVEAKEGVPMTGQREPLAKISYQRFFRRYLKLAGMSGTLKEVAAELWDVYRLHTVTIPTNRPCLRQQVPDQVFATAEAKWQAIVAEVRARHRRGRPVLIGTRSVGVSEALSEQLTAAGLTHRVLNARQDAEEAATIGEAGAAGQITVATNMAGRGTDIALSAAAREAGGLHVLATERHETGRIDRQLFGRAARQGDPGSCACILSLDDDLVLQHARPAWRALARWLTGDDQRIAGWYGRLLLRVTQRRIETMHGRIRADLLDVDQRRGDMLAFAGADD